MLSSSDLQPNASRHISWSCEDLLDEGGDHPKSAKYDFRSEEATEAGNLRPFATSLDDVIGSLCGATGGYSGEKNAL